MLTEAQIQTRIKELVGEIYSEYRDRTPVFIGILNGSFLFLSDLVKSYPGACEVDFLKLSSYGEEKISSGKVKLVKELSCDVNDRDLIIVEDIVDTGLSIKFMEELITYHTPRSMRIVSLLVKPKSLKYDVKIDYIGFSIPNKFVIGYGLDYKQQYRNLRSIYALE
jgi:hypoxanthine phosphoribosyltransferase